MSELAVFAFNTSAVRVVLKNGEPWFVAGDVAAVLGYRDAPNMVRNLDDDEKGTQIVSTRGGDQEVSVISESGLYAAVLKSRRPEAKSFRKWVTADVLPSIRKTGGYQREAADPAAPSFITHQASHGADLAVAADRTFRSYLRAGRSAGLGLAAALRIANAKTLERTGTDLLAELGVDPDAIPADRRQESAAAPDPIAEALMAWSASVPSGSRWRMADILREACAIEMDSKRFQQVAPIAGRLLRRHGWTARETRVGSRIAVNYWTKP